MVVALKPLHDRAKIKRVVVSTYQSVSGAGKEGMDELWDQTKGIYVPGQEVAPRSSQADRLQRDPAYRRLHGGRLHQGRVEDGRRDQEDRRPEDQGHATCVRVPVFVGHSEAINIEFEEFLDEDEARDILREAPGIMVVDKREDGGYVTPVECVGDYATFISRIRQDSTIENGLNLWCVSDNLRKGAALNAVQIAETLGNRVLWTQPKTPCKRPATRWPDVTRKSRASRRRLSTFRRLPVVVRKVPRCRKTPPR
jgi:aspartate-semialdehyde dehydrogenase